MSRKYQENVWRMSESFVEGRVHVYRNGSKARTFVSEASKPPAGARILKGPKGPEILVKDNFLGTSLCYGS